MTELTLTRDSKHRLRFYFLATASSLALLCHIAPSEASDSSRPTVWIELGGQLERVEGGQEPYLPGFAAAIENTDTICNPIKSTCGELAGFSSPAAPQTPSRYSIGGEATISFEPKDTDWRFSASLRYGRSNGSKRQHEQTNNLVYAKLAALFPSGGAPTYYLPQIHKFWDIAVANHESDAVIDFQAGKDVGIGILGRSSASTISLGVRFAQFASKSDVLLKADSDLYYPGTEFKYTRHHHSYVATAHNERSFWAIGPSLAWTATAAIAGDPADKDLSLNWGVNAAILFGRQKAHGSDRVITTYQYMGKRNFFPNRSSVTVHETPHARSRAIIVPNIGGFAGLSLNFPNAKIGLGYRADFFFGAVDGGVDARKTYDRNFYGPFATISIGLGG